MTEKNIQTASDLFSYLPQFHLDPQGVFKYILVKVELNGTIEYFVRGQQKFAYHAQNFEQFASDLRNCGIQFPKFQYEEYGDSIYAELANGIKLQALAIGGGRVNMDSNNKKLEIYGYSQSFGRADHSMSTSIAKQHLKDFPEGSITWNNEGY